MFNWISRTMSNPVPPQGATAQISIQPNPVAALAPNVPTAIPFLDSVNKLTFGRLDPVCTVTDLTANVGAQQTLAVLN